MSNSQATGMGEPSDTEALGEGPNLKLAGWRDLLAPAPLVAAAWTLFQMAIFIWPTIDSMTIRAMHVSFAVCLALLLTGRALASPRARAVNMVIALIALAPGLYITFSVERLMGGRIYGLDPVLPLDYVFGLLLMILLTEAARRVLGLGLTLFCGVFVLYFFLGNFLPGDIGHRFGFLGKFVDVQFLTLHGIFGVPTGVSASTVFYFILFAAVYDTFGGGRLIIDLTLAATGWSVGGPAKAAVVSSGVMGSVSGSAVANVMSSGIFTIPLMKAAGYSPRFAGAVEAAASTGGQIVPPVMGAAAFVMADLLQISYQTIVIAAIIPSIMYYLALMYMVDLQARQRSLDRISRENMPRVIEALKSRGHMLIPLVWLTYQITTGYPVDRAAIESSLIAIAVGMMRATTRRGLFNIVEALIVAAVRSIAVALPCAIAGIVVAVIAFTGLGTKFTALMIAIAGGHIAPLLILAMLASLVLGCGMPTTSAYIMAAVLLAPALIALDVIPLVAHFFVFYFAILSMVTPPVALAAYAAASLSNASSSATGWQAFALSIPGFVIPYAAVLHPGILMLGGVGDAAWGIVNILVGLTGLGAAIIGWLFRPLPTAWRVGLAVLGVVSLLPGLLISAVTFAATIGAIVYLWRSAPRPGTAQAGLAPLPEGRDEPA